MFSVIFPGQGSQLLGMGKEFYEKYDLVKKLFKEADEVLNFSLSKIILDGPKEDLDLTVNTQPAIFLHSVAIALTTDNFIPEMVAGHSLGELSALVAAQVISFEDGLRNTVKWYLINKSFIKQIKRKKYEKRLGLRI